MTEVEELVGPYVSQQAEYEDFAQTLAGLLEDLIEAESVPFHAITYRAKEPERLADKLQRTEKNYETLSDVTDLCGVRIITYFADDVDRISALLRGELNVDAELSVDKRREIPDSAFGYRSLHLVGKLDPPRARLAEYHRFADLWFEIQIRSILQHAWAEIEHDLGYKNPTSIPKALRRRFAKVAALLELADDEFKRLRDNLTDYAQKVARTVVEEPATTRIDQVSLQQFLRSDKTVEKLVSVLEQQYGPPSKITDRFWIKDLPKQIQRLGLTSIQELRDDLQTHQEDIVQAWDLVFPKDRLSWSVDMILFAHILIKISVDNSPTEARKLFEKVQLHPGEDFQSKVLDRLGNHIGK